MECPFCSPERELFIENDHALAVYDGFPVSVGHTLIIPKKHVSLIFDLDDKEYAACFKLVQQAKAILQKEHSTEAFNIGVNCGEVAGQTVMHAHIHLIPRYPGDVDDPRGGVRHIIPGKGYY